MVFALSQRAQAAGYRLESYDEAGSTNAEALERVRAGEQGPLWITARRQTAGRGRRGRQWQTLDGNLAASILRTIMAPPAAAATLSLVAGLAVHDALRACAPGLDARLKWPNDVLVGQAKLAGILLESEPVAGGVAVVVGMGVNVGMAPDGLPYPVTSVAALGRHMRPEELFVALADAWLDYERLWDQGRGMARIRPLWLDRAAGLGHEIVVQIGDRSVRGIFDTLDEEGRLVLRDENDQHVAISAGEVSIGPRAVREQGTA